MNRILYFIILNLFILGIIFGFGCKKKKTDLPPEPVIELVSVSPLSITQFKDSIIIRFKYSDNNGDLGDASADEYSLQVKDSRLANPDLYHVQPLAPIGSNIKITGELSVKLNGMFVLGNSNSETSVLTIKIKDQAGHWSNEITSPQITINK